VERSVTSRSKDERIKIKMGEAQAEGVEAKKDTLRAVGAGEQENTIASQKYTPVVRARGVS
jgi:cell division ATPase FtsA